MMYHKGSSRFQLSSTTTTFSTCDIIRNQQLMQPSCCIQRQLLFKKSYIDPYVRDLHQRRNGMYCFKDPVRFRHYQLLQLCATYMQKKYFIHSGTLSPASQELGLNFPSGKKRSFSHVLDHSQYSIGMVIDFNLLKERS